MMRLDLSAPDYTTLSRRSQHLRRRLRPVPPGEGLHLVLDSTGLSIVGAGEWAAAKHGGCGRRGWRKLHLGVDQSGGIRVHTLAEATGDDATTALDLLTAVEGPLVRVTADAAYDTVAVYETAGARGATVVIPPARTATVSGHGPRSPARDRTITLVKTLGRRQWQKASGYHRQGRVENAFFRYKSIIGDGLRARSPAGQGSEVVLGCEIPQSDDRPRPTSVVSHRQVRILSVGIVRAREDSCNNAREGLARLTRGEPVKTIARELGVDKKTVKRWRRRGVWRLRATLVWPSATDAYRAFLARRGSTFDLAEDFAEADATGARRALVQQLMRVDLLVLEDFGMKKLGSNAAEDLLEVFVRRHETASTLIITNRPTQDWGILLGDVPAATAILDRFLARATIVQMTGKSHRLRRRTKTTHD